jgi:hypothetical protein
MNATALAAVAFMTAGYGPNSTFTSVDRATGRALCYGDTVRAALNFLRSRQEASENESISAGESGGYDGLYEHSFATMAFCEAFRLTHNADFKARAERALKYIYDRQRGGGWYDSSVSGACVQALRAAKNAGFDVPTKVVEGVKTWYHRCGDSSGSTGYSNSGTGNPGLNAIGLYARRFSEPGQTVSDKFLALAAKKVTDQVGNARFTADLYVWYYAMLGLFEYQGPTGKNFKETNRAITTALVHAQHREKDCREGSFDGTGSIVAANYGRALSTAMSVLTLETYYRYVDADKAVEGGVEPSKTTPR